MTTPERPRASQIGALGFFVVALGCAALAAFAASRLIEAKGYTGEQVKPVVVAKTSLSAAQPFGTADLEVINWPASHVPTGAISDPKELFAGGKNPVPATAILAGEPVLPARLASAQQGTALAALVRDGYRAVAVKVDEAVGRSGLVYPGAHVDILATIRDPEGRGPSTRIAVEDARVLALESETDVETRRPRKPEQNAVAATTSLTGTVVTLEVKPEEAEVVSLAAREGQVDLALRNGADRKPVATQGATPSAFSAFAPEIVAGEPAPAAGESSRSTRRSSRETQLRAIREKEIETYHAR